MAPSSCFAHFKESIDHIALPEMFTFPFYYDPHPLALKAASELQHRIQNEIPIKHDFGLESSSSPEVIGKMFGVLVVKNKEGALGYLSAFSGKLEGDQLENIFVPPVYNRFSERDHFTEESEKLAELSIQIDQLEADSNLITARNILEKKRNEYSAQLLKDKTKAQNESIGRKSERKKLKLELDKEAYEAIHQKHVQESINSKFYLKAFAEYLDQKLIKYQSDYDQLNDKIIELKKQRKSKSKALQDWVFLQYNFLNSKGESKNVLDLFKGRIPNTPPAGAGECAMPKLVQYAYQHDYELIALAEFWWGKEPNSQVRKHKYFYPSCRGKCEPILNHMLEGINVAPNPLLTNPALGKKLETVYEDDHLLVINKPSEFLSVPGKNITDSVQERMHKKYPNVNGPMIVHRLDMATSGLLVLAKSKMIHKNLQDQFKNRSITKRYVALLNGVLKEDEGFIDLPLRTDHDNRPFQMVCHEHGKPSRTKWEVIKRFEKTTKVYFYPLSGRTHQLRVHAAHRDGLNTPIIGDDLYGLKSDRLHLHAESIVFKHPITHELIDIKADAEF